MKCMVWMKEINTLVKKLSNREIEDNSLSLYLLESVRDDLTTLDKFLDEIELIEKMRKEKEKENELAEFTESNVEEC